MGIPVLILGESGSGKSASMRNFDAEEIGIFNVAGKPLPFQKKLPSTTTDEYAKIMAGMLKGTRKSYAIDDSQYLLCFELFKKVNEVGYQKFTDMAVHFYDLVQFVIRKLPPDVLVYFLHHVDTVDGHIKAKTVGKMLDEKLTVEGLFSIVLLCKTDGTNHQFITQSDGYSTAKSPMEMFAPAIENDLKVVDMTIRNYYELGKHTDKKEI
ncbi:MAG: hypothetical protein RSF73_09920 [Ruthenibacterium sp.]